MTMNENDKQAEPVATDQSGLIKRIDAAIERVTQGRGLMSIPADPRSDVDLVLSECKALLQGENPPFWATNFHPAPAVAQEPVHFRAVLCGEQQDQAFGVVPKVVGFVDKKAAEQFILEKRDFQGWRYSLEPLYTEAPAVADFSDAYQGAQEDLAIWKKRALEAEELNRKFIAEINGHTFMGEPAQPVQPAGAVNEHAMNWKPLDAHAQSGRTVLLANLEAESMRDDNNAPFVFSDYWHQYRDNGCWESWNELFDEQPTHYCEIAAAEPPAAAINEQLLEALKHAQKVLNHNNLALDCVPVNAAIAAAQKELNK